MFSWEPRERPTEDELLACLSTSTPRELSPLKQKPGRTASREELVATKKRRRDESASALASQASDQSRSMTAFDMSDQDSATMQRMEGGDGAQAALFSLKRTKRLSAFGQEGGPKHYEYPPSVGRRNCDVVLPNAELKVDFSPDGLPEKISFVIDRMRAPYLGSRAKKDDRLSLCFLAAGCSSDEVGAAHKRLAEIVDRIDQFKGKGWPKATEDNPLYIKSAKEEENGEPFWTVKG
uniref:Uncharacterized protein n=1 Tax=Chromera velia CCMP2878 TaxID=1169474 RepID=A0A0G4HG52_9ALVE|eukprot:Cvel_27135.t1-p1 / transcript=Cvel_27135.t1 / gene=Cvel_27135 / organism=Chromera_velia_CCMP2878 / gene_product=hypothetical protein / transcript_product=hypothetical protein / location=Cvel_scaffold3336:5526-6230(-) / protein_length=235 / sequence_SO=supercontig / SO=protein_coding / is_pseudo=false